MENIKEKILGVLIKYNYKLYSLKYKTELGVRILEVLIDAVLTFEDLEPLHVEILDAINDSLLDNDYLEVSTIGAEKPILNLEEAKEAVGSYIFIKSDFYKGHATLVGVDNENEQIIIEAKIKTTKKQFKIKFSQLSELRYAVEF